MCIADGGSITNWDDQLPKKNHKRKCFNRIKVVKLVITGKNKIK